MKAVLVFLFLLFFTTVVINAQILIAVQNGDTPTFYESLDDAISNSENGDTLYMPGGIFNITVNISKRLHIIGAGHNPDFTETTLPTYITGSVYLEAGASSGSMTGIKVPGTIYFGSSSAAQNYTISRCIINEIANYAPYVWSTEFKNNIFFENVIENTRLTNGESNQFYNNILYGLSGIGSYNFIKNNIFLSSSSSISGICSSTFENNVFMATSTIYSENDWDFANNVFRNNLFVENISFPYLTTNIGFSYIVNQSRESIFVNQSGDSFNYTHDYHLKSDSPGKNAGRDGTDIGIYGGAFAWKEGSIPFNPHFQQVLVSPQTDANGNLNVNIKVAAQER